MKIDAADMPFRILNDLIRESPDKDIEIVNLEGQRYIATGTKDRKIRLRGIPGNALGAFLDGSELEVFDDAEDATGDTMNKGKIIIHGSAGDATGYAMRGGKIYIRGKAGYRTGIHMKAYKERQPLIIIGESAGSFLGEYLAGGTIIVLNLSNSLEAPVGYFTGTGMHGGRIILRTSSLPVDLPSQVNVQKAGEKEKDEISSLIDEFCSVFALDKEKVLDGSFYILTPDSKNPYKRLYTQV